MARAQTVWVLQKGKDDDPATEYVGLSGGNVKVTKRIRDATHMSRESDAQNLKKHLKIETGFRARERIVG